MTEAALMFMIVCQTKQIEFVIIKDIILEYAKGKSFRSK